MIQTFTIYGNPRAQGRPKFARRGKFVTAYDPKDSRDYKNNVAAQIVAHKPVFMAEGPLSVRMLFHLPRPKTLSKKITRPVKKPDIDNLVKGVFDSMKGIVWGDDSQVVELIAGKAYALEEPHVTITVTGIEA